MLGNLRKTHLLALAVFVLAAALVGCAGGGNGSSSAPTTLGSTLTNTSSTAPDVVFKMAAGGEIKFSHDDHVQKFNQKCEACHTSDTPFPMKTMAQGKTMASFRTGESCGKCHRAKSLGGTAFDALDGARCKACHQNAHETVNATLVGKENCQTCHANTVAEISLPDTSAHGRHGFDWNEYRGAASGSCSECHHHEGILGKQTAVTAGSMNHTITCQTCHDPSVNTSKRLRKAGYDLCGTCHHTRYVYGNEAGTSAWPQFYSDPTDAGSGGVFMPPAYLKKKLSLNVKTLLADADVAEVYAAFTAAVMGRYPHYSSQWDAFMGPNSPAWFAFTHDKDGTALPVTRNSALYASTNACVDCHVVKDYSAATPNTGHTFVATHASTARKYAWPEATVQSNIDAYKAAEEKLKRVIDVDGDGTPKWFVRAPQSDYNAAKALVGTSLTQGEFIVLLAAAWHYDMLHGDHSYGMHNYNFLIDITNNSYTVVTQILAGKAGLPGTWIIQ